VAILAQTLIDGLGQGVLLFDTTGNLVMENASARQMFGADLNALRDGGWNAVAVLFSARANDPNETVEAAREKAEISGKPVHFRTFRSGEYVPCWVSLVRGDDGKQFMMLTIDIPDWSAISEIVEKFTTEVQEAVEATQGHTDIINQSIKRKGDNDTVEAAAKRVTGFTKLISVHMHRVGRLINMLQRLEEMRVGKLTNNMKNGRKKVDLSSFLEDFVEALDSVRLLDPETEQHDYRARVKINVSDGLKANAHSGYLTIVLRDVIRNAIMYSMKATPIQINAKPATQADMVLIEVVDEGYGVRAKEHEAVFTQFKRARQPQIVAEFGYGLSLYLCKHEVEAMGGRMWFKTEENVGTTFSLTVPIWKAEA
jgi:nitrogen-specific signal transduction histidine kinase